jgi:glycosyltransferase involved in cell wall biosynthesis
MSGGRAGGWAMFLSKRRSSPSIPFIGGVECSYLPNFDVDLTEATGHHQRWQQDLATLAHFVTQVRYPIRWHRIEPSPGQFDWDHTDRVLGFMREIGLEPIVDLLHHTSYPRWLTDGLRDRRFGPAYLSFAVAVAERYPWLTAYTLMNEPLTTFLFAGQEGLWPPYDRGLEGFARLAANVLPALSAAEARWRELNPQARHIWVDTCEHHVGALGSGAAHAGMANDRRYAVMDLVLGNDVDLSRPFLGQLVAAGGERLLDIPPLTIDVLGLDYYWMLEWWYDGAGAHCPSPHPLGLAGVAQEYWSRYQLPLIVTETNLRGSPTDRATWLKYTLEQCELARAAGIPIEGYCWYPDVDSADWDSLLARAGGRIDPVGVRQFTPDGPEPTLFTEIWEAAASGTPASDLPAFRLQAPLDQQLEGYFADLSHWNWIDPPTTTDPIRIDLPQEAEMPKNTYTPGVVAPAASLPSEPGITADLVVLSHLRWNWVWQRPQHLVARFAAQRSASGARTWFVEEPIVTNEVTVPTISTESCPNQVTRVWLSLPADRRCRDGFGSPDARDYGLLLAQYLNRQRGEASLRRPLEVLIYTPLAYPIVQDLPVDRIAYDVMDDLASFAKAPQGLRLAQQRLLAEADVVFTGGRSLHQMVSTHRHHDCYMFPSGVDTAHYAKSLKLRRPHDRPVAGYVGVLDERLDLELLAELPELLPGWTLRMVGPVAKIDRSDLPQAANVEYLGQVGYDDLPSIMAGFDVALMPFAMNEATKSISPTKTLEYLAAGLPVVSTPVPDVVAGYRDIVSVVDSAAAMAAACRAALTDTPAARNARLRHIRGRHEWDRIAAEMADLLSRSGSQVGVSKAGATA